MKQRSAQMNHVSFVASAAKASVCCASSNVSASVFSSADAVLAASVFVCLCAILAILLSLGLISLLGLLILSLVLISLIAICSCPNAAPVIRSFQPLIQ